MSQEFEPKWNNPLQKAACIVMTGAGGLSTMSGLSVIVYQCYQWLRYGGWERLSLAWGWVVFFDTDPPFANWGGIFILESAVPMSLFFIGMGLVMFWLAIEMVTRPRGSRA